MFGVDAVMGVYYHINSMSSISILTVLAGCFLVLGFVSTPIIQARPLPDSSAVPFPDEFSDLDDDGAGATVAKFGKELADKFEQANTAYYAALTKLIRKDTARAIKEFETAISLLNELYAEKTVAHSPEYSKLVRSVVDDYEYNVTSIAKLDADAPISILHKRMLEEVERKTSVEPIAGVHAPKAMPVNKKTTIALPVNEEVQKNLDFFTVNKGRPFMKKWLERSGKWFPILRQIAREEEMPEEIIYLAMMESGLNPNAQSWAKAVGMWQFIESTGKMYDLDINTWVDERKNVEKATRAAMRFLKDLYNDLGDWHLALAAYNCGPGGVRRAQRRSGVADGGFWEIRDRLPRETKNYVPCYVATTMIAMNPEAYGFPKDSLTLMAPFAHDVYSVTGAVSTVALAKCAGITEDSLRALNPELRRSTTPPGTTYKLKIPVGTKDLVHRNYTLLTDSEKQPWILHTVQRRETLQGIAARYDVPVREIAAINNVSGYKSRLRRGTTLRIPVLNPSTKQETLLATSATPAPASTSTSAAKSTAEPTTSKATQPIAKAAPAATTVHVVKQGENLTSIANKYGVDITDLRRWNNMARTENTVLLGDSLVVSVSGLAAAPARTEKITARKVVIHKVKRGETLTEIAGLYNTTIDAIRETNRLGKRTTLKYGSRLKIETTTTTTRRVSEAPSQSMAKGNTYKVRRGDTLSSISERFGMSIANFRELNPSLRKSDIVRVGQSLRVQ